MPEKRIKMMCQCCNHKWGQELPEGGRIHVGNDGLIYLIIPASETTADLKLSMCPKCKRADGVLRNQAMGVAPMRGA